MLIHQIQNSLNSKLFNTCVYQDLSMDSHIHRGHEMICVLRGTLSVTIGSASYILHVGDCVLVTPYQIHSFTPLSADATDKNSKPLPAVVPEDRCVFFVIVFPGSDVESFAKQMEKKSITKPTFHPSDVTLQYIQEIFLKDFVIPDRQNVRNHFLPQPGALKKKAGLYAICSEAMEQCEISDKTSRDQLWIQDALEYVEAHFTEDITLEDIAKKLGYSYEHPSREFNRMLGFSFKSIVNQYRCERARHLIQTTDRSLTDISWQSGFQSVRSFNRVFKEQMGILPSDLRKKPGKEAYTSNARKHGDHVMFKA